MGNLAYKQQETVHFEEQAVVQPQTKIKSITRKLRITSGEKILGIIVFALVCFLTIKVISVQTSVYIVNKEIQDTKVAVADQRKTNDDLTVQVKELSYPDRILQVAKSQGFNRGNNVKVVEKK